jgi:hypothetical protein
VLHTSAKLLHCSTKLRRLQRSSAKLRCLQHSSPCLQRLRPGSCLQHMLHKNTSLPIAQLMHCLLCPGLKLW